MKKYSIYLFILINFLNIAGIKGQTVIKKSENLKVLKPSNKNSGSNNSVIDSIVIVKQELSLTKKFANTYRVDSKAEILMRPHFINDPISPGETNNSIYLSHLKKGTSALNATKLSVLNRIQKSNSARSLAYPFIKDRQDLEQCVIMHLPIYYITPNIVNYKEGENFAKYYTLDTSRIIYIVLKNENLLGFIFKLGDGGIFEKATKAQFEAYAQISKRTTSPVAFNQSIIKDPSQTGGEITLGYVLDVRIIFSYFEEAFTKNSLANSKIVMRKTYTLTVAEAFFAGESENNIIQQWVNRAITNFR